MAKTEFMEYLERDFFLLEESGKWKNRTPSPGQSVHSPEKGVYVVKYLDRDSRELREFRLVFDSRLDPGDMSMFYIELSDYTWSDGCPRRPYFRMRGRPVTEEQAFDILRRTLSLPFEGFDFWDQKKLLEGRLTSYGVALDNSWLDHNSPRHGWIFPDGTVGMNDHIGETYPSTLSFIDNLLMLHRAFPYLDLVLAFTDWNEFPPYAWKGRYRHNDEWEEEEDGKYLDKTYDKKYDELYRVDEETVERLISEEVFPDFLERIEFGLWLHDDTLEMMAPERAREKYQEYNRLCGETNELRFSLDPYAFGTSYSFGPVPGDYPIDMAYLRRIVSSFGLDPDKVLEGWSIQSHSGGGLIKDEKRNTRGEEGGLCRVTGGLI